MESYSIDKIIKGAGTTEEKKSAIRALFEEKKAEKSFLTDLQKEIDGAGEPKLAPPQIPLELKELREAGQRTHSLWQRAIWAHCSEALVLAEVAGTVALLLAKASSEATKKVGQDILARLPR